MAILVVLGVVTIVGACVGAFLKVSFAIRSEDQLRGALRSDATSYSAKSARTLVGVSSARWEED